MWLRFHTAPLLFILNTGEKIDGFIKAHFLAKFKLTQKFSWAKQNAFDTAFNDLDEDIVHNSGALFFWASTYQKNTDEDATSSLSSLL